MEGILEHVSGTAKLLSHIVSVKDGRKTLYWVCGSYIYASMSLPLSARVLEVGGGPDPHPATDVILEKFLNDNSHRMNSVPPLLSGRLVTVDKSGEEDVVAWNPKVVEGDVVDMPFVDKEFDFVIAKDVLEHVPDIQAAARELTRVAKAGFVDVPKVASEWVWPQAGKHVWTFSCHYDGKLVAHAIKFESPFGGLMHKVFAESAEIQDAWAKSRYFFHEVVFWKGVLTIHLGEPVYAAIPHLKFTSKQGGE